jgi:hypothetical protein
MRSTAGSLTSSPTARGVATVTLTRGIKIHITGQAVVGKCSAGAAEQLFVKGIA